MVRLLDFLWRLMSLVGLVLSLRRWWRTVADDEAEPQERALAAGILLFMLALVIWSVVNFGGLRHAAPPANEPIVASTEQPPVVDEIVVDFRDDLSLQAIDRWDDHLGVSFHPNSPMAVDDKLMVASVESMPEPARQALLDELRADPRVEAADENIYYTMLGEPVAGPLFTPNDPRYAEQWNMRMIGMPQAWEVTHGKGALVAVIDTGVAFETEAGAPVASDLKGIKYTKAYDFTKKKAKAYDDHGHGTHVTGTIAQATNNNHGVAGIAFEATIMPLKVLSAAGYGNLADIADAIRYAAENKADVINMSLGGPRGASVLRKACAFAHSQGVAIVCAAGNTGGQGVGYPAAYPECIAVSAVNPAGDLTFYSTWGKEVCIAAPGGEYRSPDDRQNGILQNTVFQKKDVFEAWQGTSMASPHVAGVVALLVSQGVKGPEAIRARLQKTATPKGDPLKYGAGLLNAAAAVGASEAETMVAAAPAHRGWLIRMATCGLWPMLLILLLMGVEPLRKPLGYGTIGFGVVVLGGLAFGLASPLWLTANGLLAVALGRLVLKPE